MISVLRSEAKEYELVLIPPDYPLIVELQSDIKVSTYVILEQLCVPQFHKFSNELHQMNSTRA